MSKQRYLTKEIINKGYDQLQFCNFLRTKKSSVSLKNNEDPTDIDVWTFDELGCHVEEFQQIKIRESSSAMLTDPTSIEQLSRSAV